jgi:hypothetical protein
MSKFDGMPDAKSSCYLYSLFDRKKRELLSNVSNAGRKKLVKENIPFEVVEK